MFTKKHSKLIKVAVKASAVAVAALFGAHTYEADAVIVHGSFGSGDNSLDGSSTSITASGFAINNGYTDNPYLNNSADAYAGTWFTFENQLGGSDVTVSVNGSSTFVPGVTVWATDGVFDGGTQSGEIQLNPSIYPGTPHVMNATGQLGDLGTQWMQDGQGGNALATLGYAVANSSINITDGSTTWGEDVVSGAHGYTTAFDSGWYGNASGNSASLTFDNLAAGWYTLYIAGTDSTSAGNSGFDLVVSAVPEAETWAMLLAGLGFVGWRLRKQTRNEPSMISA